MDMHVHYTVTSICRGSFLVRIYLNGEITNKSASLRHIIRDGVRGNDILVIDIITPVGGIKSRHIELGSNIYEQVRDSLGTHTCCIIIRLNGIEPLLLYNMDNPLGTQICGVESHNNIRKYGLDVIDHVDL